MGGSCNSLRLFHRQMLVKVTKGKNALLHLTHNNSVDLVTIINIETGSRHVINICITIMPYIQQQYK